jgi:hypothetical protein
MNCLKRKSSATQVSERKRAPSPLRAELARPQVRYHTSAVWEYFNLTDVRRYG